MSLQPLPPSLPPEQPEQSSSGIDSLTAPEKSYFEKRWEFAKQETREHKKVELMAGAIGAFATALVVGSIAGGIVAGVAAALLTALIALLVIFLYHFFRAPSTFDRQLSEQLRAARLQVEQQEAKHKLEIEGALLHKSK
ncbi:MAG: hypothetical protein H0W99_07085 [Acidobacteria bacterium]|nr:hypothetical protein [Acidobacteriota bacterium]